MQVVNPNGQLMGAPGPSGSPGVYCFADYGNPNTRADPKSLLATCALSSTYQQIDGSDSTHMLWVKSGVATSAAPNGTWTNK